MTLRELTLADLLDQAMDARQARLHVCLPGYVTGYDSVNQTVNVQPAIKDVTNTQDEREVESYPIIPNVPVVFPRGGNGFFVSFPLVPGDAVLLVFGERAIESWYASQQGQQVDPTLDRMHDLADAYAIPGGYPESASIQNVNTSGMRMGKDGGKIIDIESGEVKLGSDGASRGVARQDDTTSPDVGFNLWLTTLGPWITAVTSAMNVVGPVVGLAGALIPPAPTIPPDLGKISSSSGTVKSE